MSVQDGRRLAVLVVDDSAFVRKAVVRMLGADPALQVVGQAASGEEALAALAEGLAVDVVTLDLEMPGIGGLGTLERLRARRLPVVVLSGAAEKGAAITLQALDLGAFEVVAKPVGGPLAIHAVAEELVAKVRAAAGVPTAPPPPPPPAARRPAPPPPRRAVGDLRLIVLGTSTGGPQALQKVIPALPADFPVPVLVLQHMPPGYTRALAERLDRLSAIAVAEAADGDVLAPGRVLVAPAGFQLAVRAGRPYLGVAVQATCPIPSYYRPSIDFTFGEAAAAVGAGLLAVVMTGMGSDGAAGARAIKAAGGRVWAQDEASSTIYGMPRAAAEAGVVDAVFALGDLARDLVAAVRAGRPASPVQEPAPP